MCERECVSECLSESKPNPITIEVGYKLQTSFEDHQCSIDDIESSLDVIFAN